MVGAWFGGGAVGGLGHCLGRGGEVWVGDVGMGKERRWTLYAARSTLESR